MVELNQKAPDFTLKDQNGEALTLSQLQGRPIVLYFYPKDDTPGCTTEACAFRDAQSDYEKSGARILGVSPDDSRSHARFVKKFELNFTLLAETDQEVCKAYGVWQEKTNFGRTAMGVVRTTFLIDAKGVIRKIYDKVRVAGHSKEILESLADW